MRPLSCCSSCAIGKGSAMLGECVKLHLAHLPARFAEEDVVISVRVKRRIEINEIDTRVGKFLPIESHFRLSPKYSRFIYEHEAQ